MAKKKTLSQRKADCHSSYWRSKATAAWSHLVHKMYTGGCAVKGCKSPHTQAHHILAKKFYPHLRFHIHNGIPLCISHHKFGKQSAHKNSVWFGNWLQKTHPDLYRIAVRKVNSTKPDGYKCDYKSEYERLVVEAEKIV